MPKPDHHHPHPHRHRWIVNAEGPLSSRQLGQLLERCGREIAASESLTVDEVTVTLPEIVDAVVRQEEAPHGVVLKFEAHWSDGEAKGPVTKQIIDLLGV